MIYFGQYFECLSPLGINFNLCFSKKDSLRRCTQVKPFDLNVTFLRFVCPLNIVLDILFNYFHAMVLKTNLLWQLIYIYNFKWAQISGRINFPAIYKIHVRQATFPLFKFLLIMARSIHDLNLIICLWVISCRNQQFCSKFGL